MRSALKLILISVILFSCSQKAFVKHLKKEIISIENTFQDNMGFLLYDPLTRKTLFEYNAADYFTQASNTKILTFYTSLQLLGDSIPALKYIVRNDSLIFWCTGDPSFLYHNVWDNARTFNFLKNTPHQLFFSDTNFQTTHFGPGWAWDDYNFSFSSERSPFPAYGNVYSIASSALDSLVTTPSMFSSYVTKSGDIRNTPQVVRNKDSNHATFYPGKLRLLDTLHVPFRYNNMLLAELLTDTLKRTVTNVSIPQPSETTILHGIPSDSLYRVMMEDSDNFIAEQLLLLCADAVSDTLKTEIAINYAKKNFLFDLPDKPLWRDGSGLSRYNLISFGYIVY